MQRIILLTLSLSLAVNAFSQDNKAKKPVFGIKFSGYVKTDFFFDSRKVVAAREDHFLLRPANELLDANGDDINAQSSFNLLSVQSRLKGAINGPNAFGAKTSGLIEADFFGNANANINTLRLRHAFLKLSWIKSELMIGQYWNPMFQGACYPTTVSFNSGAGIMPFARNPQIRYTFKTGGFKFIATAFSERDYKSTGVNGSSSDYLRNSGMPALNGQVHYNYKSQNLELITGAGVGYMSIVPQSVTAAKVITNEKLNATSAIFFITAKFKPVTFKFSAVYGENMSNVLYFNSYAATNVIDVNTQELSYTPIANSAFWADLNTNGKKVQFGLFAGINTNLGAKDEIMTSFLSVTNILNITNIKNVTRISPRVVFLAGKTKFGAELEISGASYGDGTYDAKAKPLNTKTVTNNRLLLSATYTF